MSRAADADCPRNEQAVAFALHALEPEEEMAVRTHLPHCPSCQTMVRQTELVLGGLAGTVEQVDPPARLRQNILDRAAATPQAGRRPDPDPVPDPGPQPAGRAPERRSEPTRPPQRRRSIGRRRLLVAAVAVVAALGVGGLATYTAQVQAERDVEIAQTRTLADIVEELARPGTPHASLSTPQGEAVAAVLLSDGRPTLVTAGLAPNDHTDSIYVMWGTGDGSPRAIGAFDVATADAAVHTMDVTVSEPFTGFAISLEPGRALPPAPTSPVAGGPLAT